MPSGDFRCGICGMWNAPNPHHCGGTQTYGNYQFTPNQLTEADIRRIVREELDRKPNDSGERP